LPTTRKSITGIGFSGDRSMSPENTLLEDVRRLTVPLQEDEDMSSLYKVDTSLSAIRS
jgi:hypothetical protein